MKRPARSETPSFSFPTERVLRMGEMAEKLLSKEELNEEERNTLLYMKAFLQFRLLEIKRKDSNNFFQSDDNPHLKKVEKYVKEINLSRENLFALNMWLRGSREKEGELFEERDLLALLERVENSLAKEA